MVFNPLTRARAIIAPTRPPALKLASRNGLMLASESRAADERTRTKSPESRDSGAFIRRVRKRRQAAARNRTGTRYAAKPIAWKRAAATFAPTAPIQLCAPVSPAEFQEGSFGLYEARQRPSSSAIAINPMAKISFTRVLRGADSTSSSEGIE